MPRAREARLLFADCSRRGAGLAPPGSDPGGDLAPPDDDRALLRTPLLQALHALFSGRCCSWRALRARAVVCSAGCPRRVDTAMKPRFEAAPTPRGQPGEQMGVAIRCTIMVLRRLGVLEVTCFYVLSGIHAAWTLGGGADRGGAPGVAIRCTMMVFRRLWVHCSTRRCFRLCMLCSLAGVAPGGASVPGPSCAPLAVRAAWTLP